MPLEPFARSSRPEGISRSGAELDTPILLTRDPVDDDEAATKQHADDTVNTSTSGYTLRVFNRWHLPNSFSNAFSTSHTANAAICSPKFVGGPLRWSRVRLVGAVVDGAAQVEVGLYELNDRTLRPTGAPVYQSGVITAVANVAGNPNVMDLVIDAVTTSRWVGYGYWSSSTLSPAFSPGGPGEYFMFGARASDLNFGATAWGQGSQSRLPSSGAWTAGGNGVGTVVRGIPRLAFMPSGVA